MRIRSISLVVAFALANIWNATNRLPAHTTSLRELGKTQFAMGCWEQPGSLRPLGQRECLASAADGDSAPSWMNLAKWVDQASHRMPAWFSFDVITHKLLANVRIPAMVQSPQIALWARTVGRAFAPPQTVARENSLVVSAPQLGRPPRPQPASPQAVGPIRTSNHGFCFGSKFQPVVLRDWRLGPFARSVPFRVREATEITLDELVVDDCLAGSSHSRTSLSDIAPQADILAYALIHLDDYQCAASAELATMQGLANLTESAVRTANGLVSRAGAQLVAALQGQSPLKRLPYFNEPAFVICEISDGSQVLITMEQATRWNIVQRFESPLIASAEKLRSIADETDAKAGDRHAGKLPAAKCPFICLLADAIDRTNQQARSLIEQAVALRNPLANTVASLEQVFVLVADWLQQTTDQQLAATTDIELR